MRSKSMGTMGATWSRERRTSIQPAKPATSRHKAARTGSLTTASSPTMDKPKTGTLSRQASQSKRPPLRGTSGRKRMPKYVAMHMGMLTRNIQCQDATCRTKAPMVGPSTAVTPTDMALMLMPMPNLFSGEMLRTNPPNKHTSMAEPKPWAMRDNSSPSKELDTAEASEDTRNRVMPKANMRRKPMRSATADKGNSETTTTRL